ncbi:hypothetical protein [Virgibacillus halodenitrificans]|uniref:hypothetical protein n=1 Tax=Virgibacillus halodenitrificans TaxID=1482 RepID=UPI000A472CAB|nr:hypothetical protein [Virgibacillus halodenitrificans]
MNILVETNSFVGQHFANHGSKLIPFMYLIKIGFLPVFAIMDHAPKGIPPFGLPIWK